MRLLTAVYLAVILLFSGSYSASTTCPSVEIPDRCDTPETAFPCPEGWSLLSGNMATGEYRCIKPNPPTTTSIDELWNPSGQVCEYKNSTCMVQNWSKNVANMETAKLTREKGIDSIPQFLVALATFDNDVINDITKTLDNPVWVFIGDYAKVIKEKAFIFAIIVIALGIFYAIFTMGYSRTMEIYSEKKQGVFNIHTKDTLVRILFAIVVFTFPYKTLADRDEYTTMAVEGVRTILQLGNDFANELTDYGNMAFVKYIFFKNKELTDMVVESYQKSAELELGQAIATERLWAQCLQCYTIASQDPTTGETVIANLNDETILNSIRQRPDCPANLKAWLKKDYCRVAYNKVDEAMIKIARYNKYKESIMAIANNVTMATDAVVSTPKQRLSELEIDGIEEYIGSSNMVLLDMVKRARDMQAKYGWMNTFITILPSMLASDVVIIKKKDEKQPRQMVSPGTEETDSITGEDIIRPVLQTGLLLVIPPGNQIFTLFKGLYDSTMGKLMDRGITAISSFPGIGGALSTILLGITTPMEATALLGLMMLSASIAETVIKFLPILAIILFGSLKVIFYFIEIAKVTIITPFVSVWSMTIQNKHRLTDYMSKVIHITLMPVMISISIILAILANELIQWLIFLIPVDALNTIQASVLEKELSGITDRAQVTTIIGLLITIKSALFIIANLAGVIAGYKIVMQGPEWFINLFGKFSSYDNTVMRIASETYEKAKSMTRTPV